MVEPDPDYLGTEKWREHKAPSVDALRQARLRTIEAWRDYLASGRVAGEKHTAYGDAILTIRWERRQGDGFVPLGVPAGFWDDDGGEPKPAGPDWTPPELLAARLAAWRRESANEALDLLERLARVVEAMARDTALHNQIFDLVADIQLLQLKARADGRS